MANLSDILSNNGSYDEKKSLIEDMLVDELMRVHKSLVKSIVEKVGDKYGKMSIRAEFRRGNDWDSEIEGVSVSKGDVFVDVYIQTTKTDTTYCEYFDKFFRRGEYYSDDNRFHMGVDYKESQKAEVMRSILLQCVYNLFSDEKKKADQIAKLSHYTLINPVANYFYDKYRLSYKRISKYSSRDTIAEIKGYHHADKVLREYIEENYLELLNKSNEELQEIYKDIFQKSMDEFIRTFDYNAWRDNTYLWY